MFEIYPLTEYVESLVFSLRDLVVQEDRLPGSLNGRIDDLPLYGAPVRLVKLELPEIVRTGTESTPITIVLVEGNDGGVYCGRVIAEAVQRFRERYPSLDVKKYSIIAIYEDTQLRRALGQANKSQTERVLHLELVKENKRRLIERLESTRPGKENWQDYEDIVKDIFDQFFDDCLATSESQRSVSGSSFRFDLCYRINSYDDPAWERLRKETNASHIFVECKNSEKPQELVKAISQADKYFKATNVGSCGVVAIRDKSKLEKMKHYARLIQDKSIFLLVLDDSDLKKLLFYEKSSVVVHVGNKNIIMDATAVGILCALMDEARLSH